MKDLAGKAAFISGGASGIGLAIAHALAREGLRVAIGDIDRKSLEEAADGLLRAGAVVCPVVLDVADPASWTDAVGQTESAFGHVQILINNAGVGPSRGDVTEVPPEDWAWALRINLDGVFHGTQAFVGRMKATGLEGHVVNTSSVLGLFPNGFYSAYVASKFAVVGFSEAMRIELAPLGIGVSVLCPGFVRTPLRHTSQRLRPSGMGLDAAAKGGVQERPSAMEPDAIGSLVVEGIRGNRLYILSHPEYRRVVQDRMNRILSAFGISADPAYAEDVTALGGESLALSAQG
jgi:NAD(P)-dependent dehydrogenase (short-subunit alcohol dehydrogenase family)